MAAPTTIVKNFNSFKGLDLRSSDLVRDSQYATEFTNAKISKKTSVENRQGYKGLLPDQAKLGSTTYELVNETSGQIEREIIAIDGSLHRKTNETFNIAYTDSTGDGKTAIINHTVDLTTNTFVFSIDEDDTNILEQDLGTGLDETSPVTLATLKTNIEALSDGDKVFTVTISGTTSLTAAIAIPIVQNSIITSGSNIDLDFFEYEEINKTVSSPFSAALAACDQDDFENPSTINLHECLYIGTGYDELHKYDGQTVYRAGMPQPAAFPTQALTNLGAGSITDSGTKYSYLYVQYDNKGNIVEGQESAQPTTALTPSSDDVSLTLANIEDGSGFNTNGGVVVGNPSGVNTFTLDDSAGGDHTFKTGDTMYFFDVDAGEYTTRTITSVTSSTVTFSGATAGASNDDIISNNLRIKILRTQSGGTLRKVVVEIPNDSFNATQVYIDTDNAPTEDFIEPTITPSLPPKGRYLTAFQNFIVTAGDNENVNIVTVGDLGVSIEGFDPLRRSFDVSTSAGGRVSGLGANNEILLVGKEYSLAVVSGDMATFRIRVDQLTGDQIGVQSHHSIKEAKGFLTFLSADNVYRIAAGQIPESISDAIQPVFVSDVEDTGASFSLKRATAVNDIKNRKYLLFLPDETIRSGEGVEAGENSRIYAFDYDRLSWSRYDNINAMGGFFRDGNDVWFTERRFSSNNSAMEHVTYKFSDNDNIHDYMDHVSVIPWNFSTDWEFLGDPSVFKRILRFKPHSFEPIQNDAFDIDVNVEFNFVDDLTINSGTLTVGIIGTGYGFGGWGNFPWGNNSDTAVRTRPLKMRQSKAQSWRFRMSNEVGQTNVKLSGYEQQVVAPFKVDGGIKE